MSVEQTISPTSLKPTHASDVYVPGNLHRGIRAAFGASLALIVVLFVAALFFGYGQLRQVCTQPVCHPLQLSAAEASLNSRLGLTLDFYATFATASYLVFGGICLAVATLIFWYRPDNWISLFVAAILIGLATGAVPTLASLSVVHPAVGWLALVLRTLFVLLFPVLLYVFPDGRFVPHWTKWLVTAWVVYSLMEVLRDPLPVAGITGGPPSFGTLSFFVAGGLSQIYRYAKAESPVQRQQTKWALFGFVGHIVALVVLVQFLRMSDLHSSPIAQFAYERYAFSFVGLLPILFVPLSLALCILRYRLWDIDVIVNRALVYAILTLSTMLLYAAIVGGLSAWFHRGTLVWAFIATGIVAVSFHAIREQIQGGINRLMYGHRDEPYVVLERLSQQLTPVTAVGDVLPTLARTVAEALRLPYAGVALFRDGDYGMEAEFAGDGMLRDDVARTVLPLVYQSEPIGQLHLATRRGETEFSAAELRLLDSIARQASIAAYNVRLTSDLQRSREELVAMREEERRRLRRDLHDGLGPLLAVMSFRLDEVNNVLDRDPGRVREITGELKTQVQSSLKEIRRIAYGLRPPALDELGLVGALHETVTAVEEGAGPAFDFHVPDQPLELPAAVEVAAYHIAMEAITNVLRHAKATKCQISLCVQDDALQVDIIDDGRGVSAGHHAGIGLSAMRERASELGGTCELRSFSHGTHVQAILPTRR